MAQANQHTPQQGRRITLQYGNGDPKKYSVRFKALTKDALLGQGNEANNSTHTLTYAPGDIYISREIMDEIGATDRSVIYVTFETEPK